MKVFLAFVQLCPSQKEIMGEISIDNNQVSQAQGGEVRPGSCLAEEQMRHSSDQFMRKHELTAGRESNLYFFWGWFM